MLICFTDNLGVEHCFELPQVVREWPDPDPGPDPDPWLRDISLLDLVSQVARRVSDDNFSKALSEVAAVQLDKLQAALPAQVRLEGHGVRG